jgi:hypothetical protein
MLFLLLAVCYYSYSLPLLAQMASMLYGHIPQVIGVIGAGQMGSGIAQVRPSQSFTLAGTPQHNKPTSQPGYLPYVPYLPVCTDNTTRSSP